MAPPDYKTAVYVQGKQVAVVKHNARNHEVARDQATRLLRQRTGKIKKHKVNIVLVTQERERKRKSNVH